MSYFLHIPFTLLANALVMLGSEEIRQTKNQIGVALGYNAHMQ